MIAKIFTKIFVVAWILCASYLCFAKEVPIVAVDGPLGPFVTISNGTPYTDTGSIVVGDIGVVHEVDFMRTAGINPLEIAKVLIQQFRDELESGASDRRNYTHLDALAEAFMGLYDIHTQEVLSKKRIEYHISLKPTPSPFSIGGYGSTLNIGPDCSSGDGIHFSY